MAVHRRLGRNRLCGVTRTSPTLPAGNSLFRWKDGQLTATLNSDDPLPGHSLYTLEGVSTPIVNEAGDWLVSGLPGGAANGLLSGRPGDFRLIAFGGVDPTPAPTYLKFPDPLSGRRLTPSNIVGFITDPLSNRFWAGPPDDLRNILSTPAPAPGYPATVSIINMHVWGLDDAGRLLVSGSLWGGGVDGKGVLVLADRAGLQLLIGVGSPAPGTAGTITSVGGLCINRHGLIGFSAKYEETAGGPARYGAWVGPPGTFVPIVRTGQAAPGLPEGFQFTVVQRPTVNRAGHALLTAFAERPGVTGTMFGLWVHAEDKLKFVARVGTPVSNMPPGTIVESFEGPTTAPPSWAFNGRDQLAFIGRLKEPGRPPAVALMVADSAGRVVAVAVVGSSVEVRPGEARVVDEIDLFTNGSPPLTAEDGGTTFFNYAGQLVLNLFFEDGTAGVFLARVPVCASDCDDAGGLDIKDFVCFQNAFALGDLTKADCDASGALDVLDFVCFQNQFALGCP